MKGEERILFWLEHPVDGVVLPETQILGIGAPFGGPVKSSLLKMLQKKFSQPGGCESVVDRRGRREGSSAKGKAGMLAASPYALGSEDTRFLVDGTKLAVYVT